MNKNFSRLYKSASLYGASNIVKEYLGLSGDCVLPITIPHGVDFYHLRRDLDLDGYEPIYLAFREDIAKRAGVVKLVLKFPHPWLLLTKGEVESCGSGTLFIAPPPSEQDFQKMLDSISLDSYERPWGVLIKERGTQRSDIEWWESKGFITHSAGLIGNQDFYKNLRNILSLYRVVASPNMSSAVIFAVAIGKYARAIPNVSLAQVDVRNIENILFLDDLVGKKIRQVWNNLLTFNQKIALKQARELLGYQYLDSPERLHAKLSAAKNAIKLPLNLHPLKKGVTYYFFISLISAGIPVHKLFPNPFFKLKEYLLSLLKLNQLTIIIGSDFSHYGVAGNSEPLRFKRVFAFQLGSSDRPGFAVRNSAFK